MIIYKATNTINNKIYIGQTINTLEYRANQHLRETNSLKKKNTYFHNAISKYGFDNFKFEIIDEAETIEELNEKERFWIQFYDSTNEEFGYNLDSGGANCLKSASTKEKIGKTSIEKRKNPEIAAKMKDGLNKATKIWVQQCEDQRITFICPVCGKERKLTPHEIKNRKTCSSSCGGKTDVQRDHLRKLSQEKHERNLENKALLRDLIYEWCNENRELVLACPYNKITTTLEPMLKKFCIYDIRNIFICFDVKNRKELLTCLKNYLIGENIC